MEEIFKDVPDYEGVYQVSNLGRVKSLKFGKEKILTSVIDGRGYLKLSLFLKVKKQYKVHQLVAMAFLGHKINGHKLVVDHIDNDKLNNRVDNLQIVTQRFNVCRKQGKYSSQYKGVSFAKNCNRFRTQIFIDGKLKTLGYFTNELEASEAYQNKLKEIQ